MYAGHGGGNGCCTAHLGGFSTYWDPHWAVTNLRTGLPICPFAAAASPIATRKSRRTLVGKRRPLHHAGSSSHHISLHDSSNPADQIMDAVASLSAEGVELAANAVARRFQTQAKVDTGAAVDGKQHVIAIAPLWHRTAALVLRRTWKESFATRLSNCPGPPAAVKRP